MNEGADITALRERIRAAAEGTERARLLLGLAGFEVLAAGLGGAVALGVRHVQFWEILAATAAGGLAGFLLRYPLAAGYRWLQHRRLRRQLAALPAERRAALLDLLEDEPLPDTAPYRRDLLEPP